MLSISVPDDVAGQQADEVVREYPTLTPEGIRAAVAYAAWLAKQEIHPLTPGT